MSFQSLEIDCNTNPFTLRLAQNEPEKERHMDTERVLREWLLHAGGVSATAAPGAAYQIMTHCGPTKPLPTVAEAEADLGIAGVAAVAAHDLAVRIAAGEPWMRPVPSAIPFIGTPAAAPAAALPGASAAVHVHPAAPPATAAGTTTTHHTPVGRGSIALPPIEATVALDPSVVVDLVVTERRRPAAAITDGPVAPPWTPRHTLRAIATVLGGIILLFVVWKFGSYLERDQPTQLVQPAASPTAPAVDHRANLGDVLSEIDRSGASDAVKAAARLSTGIGAQQGHYKP